MKKKPQKRNRMKKKVMHEQPPGLNVLLYKYNRQVCDSYKLFVKNVRSNQWFLVTLSAGKVIPALMKEGLKTEVEPIHGEPPKEMVKLK